MADEIAKEVAQDPEGIQKGVTTFKANDKNELYIEERQIKALLRETAQRTGLLSRYGMRDVFQHAVFADPSKIHRRSRRRSARILNA